MFLYIGASLAVAGEKWLQWRNPNRDKLGHGDNANFVFGAVPEGPIQGKCVVRITLPPKIAYQKKNQLPQLLIHVAKETPPLLISIDSLAKLQAAINFSDSAQFS